MKTILSLWCLPLVLAATVAGAKPLDVVGEDDASKTEYGSGGWATGKGDGTGFGKWTVQTSTGEAGKSHAGFYIASADAKPDLNNASMRGKAFGMYANGTAFEAAAAFRAFDKPLKVGQSFSFMMEHGDIVKKFDLDAEDGGAVGMTLRSGGNESSSTDDYNKGVRFEFGYYQHAKAYVIYDKDGETKLDLPLTDAGLAVTLTLVTGDTYNLEITTLADKKTTKLTGRKLGGEAGSLLTSFCLFDRNGETNDVYFNGFQILQAQE